VGGIIGGRVGGETPKKTKKVKKVTLAKEEPPENQAAPEVGGVSEEEAAVLLHVIIVGGVAQGVAGGLIHKGMEMGKVGRRRTTLTTHLQNLKEKKNGAESAAEGVAVEVEVAAVVLHADFIVV